jgi:hypothetical protein
MINIISKKRQKGKAFSHIASFNDRSDPNSCSQVQEEGYPFFFAGRSNRLSKSSVLADSAGDSSTGFQQFKKCNWASLPA